MYILASLSWGETLLAMQLRMLDRTRQRWNFRRVRDGLERDGSRLDEMGVRWSREVTLQLKDPKKRRSATVQHRLSVESAEGMFLSGWNRNTLPVLRVRESGREILGLEEGEKPVPFSQ